MFRTKRGQSSAAGAAVLIAIIAALIVGFVILIPPQERAKLLDEPSTTTSPSSGVAKNLLMESPGRIDYLAQKEIEHPLPVVNIYTKTEAKVLGEKNVAYAKKGVFSEKADLLTFMIPDLKNTEDLLLALEVVEAEGRLIVSFNGDEVFNGEVKVGSLPKPITIPSNLLQEQNEVVFSVSSPGLAFWRTNELSLQNVKIVADVTSVEAQASKNIFLLSEVEKKNLEKVTLKFQPGCDLDEVGKLTVLVNGKVVYAAVPDCDVALVPIEISPGALNQGENEIIFKTEQGTYLLTHVVIESELKEVDFPTYYFDLTYEEYSDVVDEDKRVRITLDFVDVVARKFGDLEFNGHTKYFDTKEVSYTLDVSDDVVQGANALKIKPRKTLEVRQLKIDLVKA
ncbi:hypothetical protein HYV87_02955 [Candidatus Woesearchaeota archaeon]|nr:hypothetical protein [Candidatus Woesearchaeota archaeon]